jgi:uncharacterized membrane protein
MPLTERHHRVAAAKFGLTLVLGVVATMGSGCSELSCEETLTCPPPPEGNAGATGGSGTAGAATGGTGGASAGTNTATGGDATGGSADSSTAAGRGGSTSDASGGDAGAESERGAMGGTAGKSSGQENAGAAGSDSNACDDVTCTHGGACEPSGTTFKCECAPGYDGKYCEHNINECQDVPCLHGGSCTDGVNEYACDCEGTGYFGESCEIAHFEWIGPPGARPLGMSADGKVVVGSVDQLPARWTTEAGFEKLQALAEPVNKGWAFEVNADGHVIAGSASLLSGEGAFRWTATTGVVSLHLSPDSDVYGISADGNILAGSTRPGGGTTSRHAFLWTPSAGAEDLGDIGSQGEVSGMSADGSVIVGYNYDSHGEASSFRWTRSTGIVWLAGVKGSATSVSGDGTTIVGDDDEIEGTFVYTDEDGYAHLDAGDLSNATARTVSYDGSVIAGDSIEREWVWDRSNGARLLADLLRARGTDPGNLYGYVYAVSADGKVFTGEAVDEDSNQSRPWIARL